MARRKIPHDLTPLAYDISKRVYENAITFSDGQKELVGDNRMNSNSAADYINNFRCMMDGNRFTRTNNAYSMEYFFENIFKDFGAAKLSNALTALKLHIEYYEDIQKVRMHKMREIYDKYFATEPIETPDEKEQNEIVQELRNDNKSKQEIIDELKKLKETDTEIVEIKSKVYKRDNKTVAQIKFVRDFKCQICLTTIKKKDGSFYVEAAHIKPKHLKGRETPDNIILLCPNHHKEFDLGERQIISQDKAKIIFTLNGERHELKLLIE